MPVPGYTAVAVACSTDSSSFLEITRVHVVSERGLTVLPLVLLFATTVRELVQTTRAHRLTLIETCMLCQA